jgi:1-phosphofructokinase family hexose kinase
MILCITPNPAIDRTIILPDIVLGNVHRAEQVIIAAGGKGLNVARTIRILGGEALCMGFAGGHAGHLLGDLAQKEGLAYSLTWTNSETRTCTILVSRNGGATEVDEPGLPVSQSDWKRLRRDVRGHIASADLICVCGSFPPESANDDVRGLFNLLVETGKPVWVDTSGNALDIALSYPGISIKVNAGEISKSLGFEINDVPSAQRALTVLRGRGLTACAITLGAAGAFLATIAGRWHAQGLQVSVVSPVGSGDSFLGGLMNAQDAAKDWPEALRDAVAAGTANVLSAGGGHFGLQEFQDIREKVHIQPW